MSGDTELTRKQQLINNVAGTIRELAQLICILQRSDEDYTVEKAQKYMKTLYGFSFLSEYREQDAWLAELYGQGE